MKWQRARDIRNGYLLWVEIGRPIKLALKEINKDSRSYGQLVESDFYRTNMRNPINDPSFPLVAVRASEMELLPEFCDEPPIDEEWFK